MDVLVPDNITMYDDFNTPDLNYYREEVLVQVKIIGEAAEPWQPKTGCEYMLWVLIPEQPTAS